MSYQNEHWFKVLLNAVDTFNSQSWNGKGGKKKVADMLGLSRPTISQIMNGKYLASPGRVAKKVLDVLTRVHCPYLNAEITAQECLDIRSGETPSHDPMRLAHRRMCRTCSHNTQNTQNENNSIQNPVNG
ncbi:helix-turn-helix domain-containing protein [Nitrosomonas oligotropha]|uniref:helix-turn-helix domain-containing protein n=1 Tax=Nitrosomonas oligotropha TaxID=42354 RepID=UPI00136FD859|nr:helix-turn-helix transcriptional regulator [Nitrosomonas oligotropha]MXS82243.1 XRE family transcriptional regulator [Nitrosomonas oligotropha]